MTAKWIDSDLPHVWWNMRTNHIWNKLYYSSEFLPQFWDVIPREKLTWWLVVGGSRGGCGHICWYMFEVKHVKNTPNKHFGQEPHGHFIHYNLNRHHNINIIIIIIIKKKKKNNNKNNESNIMFIHPCQNVVFLHLHQVWHILLWLGNPDITPAEPVSLRTIFWQVAQSWTFSCSKPVFFGWQKQINPTTYEEIKCTMDDFFCWCQVGSSNIYHLHTLKSSQRRFQN